MKFLIPFSVVNFLIGYYLESIGNPLGYTIEISIAFFSFLFLQIHFLTKLFNKKGIDTMLSALALNIGLKFMLSLIFVFAMYWFKAFTGNFPIIIFMFYYFTYTFLMAKYGVNKLI